MKIPGRGPAERRIAVRDQRPDADHVRVDRLIKKDIARQRPRVLPRQADERARADLVPERAQIAQAAQAVLVRHTGIEPLIERRIRRLDAQQIAVGPRRAPERVRLAAALADRERHREVERLDAAHDGREALRREMGILARLQHDGLIAVVLRLARERDDGVRVETVALDAHIVPPQTAVAAVLPADIRELDEPAQMHAVADIAPPHRVRSARERLLRLWCCKEPCNLLLCQAVRPRRPLDELLHALPPPLPPLQRKSGHILSCQARAADGASPHAASVPAAPSRSGRPSVRPSRSADSRFSHGKRLSLCLSLRSPPRPPSAPSARAAPPHASAHTG